MTKVKTKSGFEVEVDTRKVVDFRFLKSFVKVAKGATDVDKLDAYISMVEFLFSKDDCDRFYDHIAEQHEGIVETDAVTQEFNEIIEACKETNDKVKN